MTQLECSLANEDTDEEDDQPSQQAHTFLHQLACEADKRKPDISYLNITLQFVYFILANMTMNTQYYVQYVRTWFLSFQGHPLISGVMHLESEAGFA